MNIRASPGWATAKTEFYRQQVIVRPNKQICQQSKTRDLITNNVSNDLYLIIDINRDAASYTLLTTG